MRFINPVPQFWLDNGSVASFGKMYFYENKDYSTPKDTYSQPDNTIPNGRPVPLDGHGRMPPCFGDGLYSVKFYSADGSLQWTRDDVSLASEAGQFTNWSPAKIYSIGDVAKDTIDGEYYRLWGAPSNVGSQPSSSPLLWEKIIFITEHVTGKSYSVGDTVSKSGFLYRSETDANITSPPGANWQDLTFNQIYQNYTPVAIGSSSDGVGTYTIQRGSYLKIGRLVVGTVDLFWTAHTGTGNLDISLPIAASVTSGAPSGGGQVINSQSFSWTAGKQLTVLINSGFSVARIIGLESGASGAQIPLDTNAGISIQFSYFVD